MIRHRRTSWQHALRGISGPKYFPIKWRFSFLWLSICLLVCLSSVIQAVGQTPEFPSDTSRVLRIHKYDLLNGLKTFVVQQDEAAEVAVALLIKAGSVADPPEKNGVANLVAQMLLMANPRKSNEQWLEEIQALDVDFKITLEPEATLFEATVAPKNLEAYLSLLNILILYPRFQSERFEPVKQTLIKGQLGNQQIMELAEQHFRQLVFGRHPYARSLRGDPESLKAIRVEDLTSFYGSYYIPNNAALVIVGNVTPSEVIPFVREKWGGWTKGTRPGYFFPKIGVRDNYSVQIVPKKDADWAGLIYGHVAPPRATTDYFSLTVLNMVLGGLGPSSRLAAEFERRHLSFQRLQSLFLFHEAGGEFQVTASVPNESVSQALQTISDTIETLKQQPVKEAEMRAAQNALVNEFAAGLKIPTRVADHVVHMELYDLASDYLLAYPKRVEQISVERLQEAARTYLDPSRAVAVVVGDTDRLPRDLDRLSTQVSESGSRAEQK